MRWIMIMALLAGCASVRVEEENEQLKARVAQLEKELSTVKYWLERYRGGEIMIQGSVTARVLEVKGTLVALSIGAKSGVQVGDVFLLRRGATYVGQATVTKVKGDTAIATFDDELTGPGAPPKVGDYGQSHS